MTKVAVAHTATVFGDEGEVKVNVGDTFPIIEEPSNMMHFLLLMQFGGDPDAIIVDLGVGAMVFSVEPDEEGRHFGEHFELREVS